MVKLLIFVFKTPLFDCGATFVFSCFTACQTGVLGGLISSARHSPASGGYRQFSHLVQCLQHYSSRVKKTEKVRQDFRHRGNILLQGILQFEHHILRFDSRDCFRPSCHIIVTRLMLSKIKKMIRKSGLVIATRFWTRSWTQRSYMSEGRKPHNHTIHISSLLKQV